ncbi:MAG: hypothetical protein L6N94_05995 [Candidatus Methylarchaceae archaeon HK01M]|nr:hypothetical protein [Candidatus Methylarchaceae archaeon HK01M]
MVIESSEVSLHLKFLESIFLKISRILSKAGLGAIIIQLFLRALRIIFRRVFPWEE